MAGGKFGSSNENSSYYLYTNQYYWAGSSSICNGSSSIDLVVGDDGSLGSSRIAVNRGVRGVVSLSSDAKLLGNGTYNDVYTVS